MNIERIAQLETEVSNLKSDIRSAKNALYELKSQDFIEANGIKKEDVCNACDDYYFNEISMYIEFLKSSTKKWCEWNGQILSVKELIDGTSPIRSDGRYADLK